MEDRPGSRFDAGYARHGRSVSGPAAADTARLVRYFTSSYTMTLKLPGTIVGRPGLPSAPAGPGL